MSSHRKLIPGPDFDVKIVGGKKMVIWRQSAMHDVGNLHKSRSMSALDQIPDNRNRSFIKLPPIKQPDNILNLNPEYDGKLWLEIHGLLKTYDEAELIAILEDLIKRDFEKQRLTTPKTLTAIAAQHQLPIPPYLLHILCERFATNFIPTNVQFESLLNYLINCKKQLPPNLLSNRSISLSTINSASSQTIVKTPQLEPLQRNKDTLLNMISTPKSRLRIQDKAQLIQQLEKELEDDDMRLDLFRRQAYELDSGRRGVLTKPQLEELLKLTNITISDELLSQLASFCDKQGYGFCDITEFLSFFENARVQAQTLFQPSERRIIRPNTPNLLIAPLPKMHFAQNNTRASGSSHPESAVAHMSSAMAPLTQEDWLNRFERMVSALRSSCQDQRDFMPISEVLRIVDNYNIVYNLQIDSLNIQKSIDYASRNFAGFISIESFASRLRDLHLAENYWSKF